MSSTVDAQAPAGRPSTVPLAVAIGPHLTRAHAAARAVLGCDHLAHDAVQEALLATCRETAPPADLRAWFVRTVVHRARHLRRTLVRRRRHEHHAAAHCELHPDCDNPLHHAHAHELSERLAAAIATLPPTQRDLFACHDHDVVDYAGLAARFELPIGTVRSRLHRARRAVRHALRFFAPDPG